jgi:hypothetical protein
MVVSACIFALVMAWTDPSLEHRGKRIASLSPAGNWTWLTSHSVLIYTWPEREARNALVQSVDIDTGQRKTLPIDYKDTSTSLCATPDGRTVAWEQPDPQGWTIHIAHTDGSGQIAVKDIPGGSLRNALAYGWMADGSGLIGVTQSNDLWICRIKAPATVDSVMFNHWGMSYVFHSWNDIRCASINAYSDGTLDATTVTYSLDDPSVERKKYEFSKPWPQLTGAWSCSLSPDGKRLAFIIDLIPRAPAIVETLDRLHIHLPWSSPVLETLWVCSVTGAGMHQLAQVDSPQVQDMSTEATLTHLQWSPDGRRLGCTYKNCLYVVNPGR